MSFVDTLNEFAVTVPSKEEAAERLIAAQPQPTPVDPSNYNWQWQREYDALRAAGAASMGGYVSPYEGTGWGGNPLVMNNLEKMFMAAAESKLDPMRLFTAETVQLRSIGTEQAKILRLFEAKLRESLTEKGKFGLNEMDIEGLQALTAGKNVMIAAVKEQVNVKAKQAELKIKQQQAANQAAGGGVSGRGSDGIPSGSPYGFGRDFIDNIFNTPLPTDAQTTVPASIGTEATPDQAATFLDNIGVDNNIMNEAQGYTMKVIMDGDDAASARFAMVDRNDNEVELPGQSLPDPSTITVSSDGESATGDGMVSFDVIHRR
jgi:hypothetical protein